VVDTGAAALVAFAPAEPDAEPCTKTVPALETLGPLPVPAASPSPSSAPLLAPSMPAAKLAPVVTPKAAPAPTFGGNDLDLEEESEAGV